MPEAGGLDPRYIRSEVPEGASGDWVVERFDVSGSSASTGSDDRPRWARRQAGRYTLLRRGEVQYMTDLYEEWWTQRVAIDESWRRGGEVLVTGLGLGLLVESVLGPPASPVKRVTVVERSADVIHLAGPHLQARYGERLRIVRGDAFVWEPPEDARYTVGWHDVWPDPYGAEVSAQMRQLERRFRGLCDWQGSWPREFRAEFGADETGRPAGS